LYWNFYNSNADKFFAKICLNIKTLFHLHCPPFSKTCAGYLNQPIHNDVMREEVENWLKQSQADLRKAEILFNSREFDGAVFFCQQSVEKALKAVAIAKLRESQKGHSIIISRSWCGFRKQ